MRNSKPSKGLTLGLVLLFFAASLRAGTILVFAAASLSDCLTQAGTVYQRETGTKVEFSFEASSLLAEQIKRGAPADLFASADEAKMDQVAAKGLIVAASRRDLLSNTLVAVARKDSPLRLDSAEGLFSPEIQRLALADPRTVPAGIYAKEYLTAQNLWERLEPKVIPAGNVRGALQAVVAGNAEVGMVYKTDALISDKVRVLFEVPASRGPRIRYPFAMVAGSAHVKESRAFLDWLSSAQGRKLFQGYGFTTVR